MINSQVPFTSPSLWGFHLSLKLTDTTLTLKDTYLLILLCTLWKPNEVWKPAEPRIIFYRFCWGRVVTTVTSLIEFDKKWWLAILWKHFIFCATYWNHCGGAITSHNLATVQTDKMLLLSLQKGKCLLCNLEITFSQFILSFIEIQFVPAGKDGTVFMLPLTNEKNFKVFRWTFLLGHLFYIFRFDWVCINNTILNWSHILNTTFQYELN